MSQATNAELMRIVRNEQARRVGLLFAFVAVTRDDRETPFQIGVAVLGDSGHRFPAVPMLHLSYESASAMAERLNNLHGLSESAAIAIVADTMHRSRMAQQEREGLISITATKEEWLEVHAALDFADECEDMADRIQDALRA